MLKSDPAPLTIRRAALHDLDSIIAIEDVSFPTPWTRRAMEDELRRSGPALYIAAESHGALVAYGGAWVYVGEAHIMNVAVAPGRRRRGIGEALLLELLRRSVEGGADLAYLEVRPSNAAALGLYEKLGFEAVGQRTGYYRDTSEDAILMALFDLRDDWLPTLDACWEAWERQHGPRPEVD